MSMNKTRNKIWLAYDKRCSLCGRFMKLIDVTIDHIIPKSKGGENHINNYAPAHKICNFQKGNSGKIQKSKIIETIVKKEKIKPIKVSIEERWFNLFNEPLPEKYRI